MVASYPLLSLTPTPVEVELGCDNIPRYDPISNDPQSVKAALSQLYNDTLVQLPGTGMATGMMGYTCMGHQVEKHTQRVYSA